MIELRNPLLLFAIMLSLSLTVSSMGFVFSSSAGGSSVNVTTPANVSINTPTDIGVNEDGKFSVSVGDVESGGEIGVPRWQFGDGSNDYGNTTHSYEETGSYQVSVTVAFSEPSEEQDYLIRRTENVTVVESPVKSDTREEDSVLPINTTDNSTQRPSSLIDRVIDYLRTLVG